MHMLHVYLSIQEYICECICYIFYSHEQELNLEYSEAIHKFYFIYCLFYLYAKFSLLIFTNFFDCNT